jgi:hypothetical protein
MREHWDSCITHFDEKVANFISDYFSASDRRCIIFAGAGFDPRSRRIAEALHSTLGTRLMAYLVREERADPAEPLRQAADENEASLKALVANTVVERVRVFDPEDGAPIGGSLIARALANFRWPEGITDVVLDASALSTGIGFPMARFLLEYCEAQAGLNFHIMITSNPELDERIVGEPYSNPTYVRGFQGAVSDYGGNPIARIWLPQLASGRMAALLKIRAYHRDEIYKVCPVLPFPARNPRRADDLISEFGSFLTDEGVDARDLLYVSERNPLDSYRKVSMLKKRYDRTVEDIYTPELLLSPLGSKVMAFGAMMAAIEHGLPVQHVENLRYEYGPAPHGASDSPPDMIVHIWLHGPIYAGYHPARPDEPRS